MSQVQDMLDALDPHLVQQLQTPIARLENPMDLLLQTGALSADDLTPKGDLQTKLLGGWLNQTRKFLAGKNIEWSEAEWRVANAAYMAYMPCFMARAALEGDNESLAEACNTVGSTVVTHNLFRQLTTDGIETAAGKVGPMKELDAYGFIGTIARNATHVFSVRSDNNTYVTICPMAVDFEKRERRPMPVVVNEIKGAQIKNPDRIAELLTQMRAMDSKGLSR